MTSPEPDRELERWRAEFPILEKSVYMISNSLGAMPRGVYDELRDYADIWAQRGVRAWHDRWIDIVGETGDIYADVLDADHGTVTMVQNVSIAQWIVASCFDFSGARRKVVYTDMNFPSVMYVYEEQRRRGAEIEVVPSDDGIGVDLQRLLDAIDERTLLVPVSHVLFRSAFIQDAKSIIEKAHRVGAKVVLDTYQSAGCVPLSARRLGVDFIVGGSVKWLCGGPGAGYLYVRPDIAKDLHPMLTGWFAHKRPFLFEVGAVDLRDDADRFASGTPHIPAIYAARAGIKIIREIGVERIRRHSLALTDRIIDRARRNGFRLTVPEDHAHRGGTVAFDVPHAKQVTKELLDREFVVDWRPLAGIRVSPHFYSTAAECDRIVDEIKSILAEKSYEKHSDAIY
jgi:kynureninase